MLRFFLLFVFLQLSLFGINMLGVVQQHVVLPWTALLARICVGLVTLFDSTAAAAGKVLRAQGVADEVKSAVVQQQRADQRRLGFQAGESVQGVGVERGVHDAIRLS